MTFIVRMVSQFLNATCDAPLECRLWCKVGMSSIWKEIHIKLLCSS